MWHFVATWVLVELVRCEGLAYQMTSLYIKKTSGFASAKATCFLFNILFTIWCSFFAVYYRCCIICPYRFLLRPRKDSCAVGLGRCAESWHDGAGGSLCGFYDGLMETFWLLCALPLACLVLARQDSCAVCVAKWAQKSRMRCANFSQAVIPTNPCGCWIHGTFSRKPADFEGKKKKKMGKVFGAN